MSDFLPEKKIDEFKYVPPRDRDERPSDTGRLRRDVERLFSHPEFLPEKFLAHMVDYLAINQPPIPISLISGFSLTTWGSNEVATDETSTSSSYGNLATTGPQVTGLLDGTYLVIAGFRGKHNTVGRSANMSLSVNSAAASDDDVIGVSHIDYISVARAYVKTLSNAGSNTVLCVYNNGALGTANFARRWLIVQRLGEVT